MADVFKYIDEHFDETVATLKQWCAQPSVSTEGIGVEQMAKLASSAFRDRGFSVEVFETPGYPILLAEAGPANAPTVVIYNHYDVQPAGDLSEWTAPPFRPEVRDGLLFGRGSADTKGNIVARLDAIEALRRVNGELPVRIVWLLEGEEETGSANLGAFLFEHGDRLRAVGCIWESGSYGWDRAPNIYLGLKGMLSVELVAKGPARDLHSSMAAYVESPVWRLIWALASLKGPDGKVRIPGFYESVHVPTAAQDEAIASIPDNTARDLESMGVRSFLDGMTGSDVYRANSFSPTANIQGIQAGYSGPGSKTILPKEARAKMDIRLVPDQDPASLFDSLRRYLDENGFGDVAVERMEGEADLYPAASDPSSPFVQKVIQACREVSGRAPVVLPSMGGSGPMAPFTSGSPLGLGLPTAGFGVGNPDSRAHGPNENIRLSDMRDHMHSVARLLELLAVENGTGPSEK